MQFAFFLCVRAITSCCVNLCKIEKGSLFTHFGSKNIHISWGKIVHLCTIATVTMHICTATVAFAYHILVFFFSLSPSLLLSIHSDSNGLTSLFRFLNRSEQWKTLSALSFSHLIPLASTIVDRHQSLTTTTTDFHHHRSLISPPISDLSTDLIAFLYFWLFDQWASGWMGLIWLSFGLNGISGIWVSFGLNGVSGIWVNMVEWVDDVWLDGLMIVELWRLVAWWWQLVCWWWWLVAWWWWLVCW